MGFNCYSCIKDATLSDLLRQTNIKTENQLVDFSDYSWKYCTYTDRSTGAYIFLYRGVPIEHVTRLPVPLAQLIA